MGIYGVLQPLPVLPRAPSPALSWFHHHPFSNCRFRRNRDGRRQDNCRISGLVVFVNQEDSPSSSSGSISTSTQEPIEQGNQHPDPQDLEYVSQIKTVLELLRKNRDMLFDEVKLTIMIEDPRDVERKRLLGIDDENAPTREDLADALVQVNEGKIPEDREALQMLAEEMLGWPNLEVEAPKKTQPGKSLYEKVTDTGVNPQEAAKRLNIDWDSAADIKDVDTDDVEVPPAVGYGALYLVTAFPVVIGISVVLILFYNSLQ
ncbi:ycf3-interacting protein 1, chloroplastic [Andrographis paniculata]|uniref:ycf3-interacting protein 1, chloroplastic n=1 Tax=Andrographis paniculata TaxID=175694 RepID=UPI0021E750A1|nr:ycf3-interacting protein 1, chloroplastic [Andrographis paniculata]